MRQRCGLGLLILLLFVLSIGPATLEASDRDYDFSNLQIDVGLNADGSLEIREQRTVEFDGRYTGMWQWIALKGGMQVSDVVVAENGVPYTKQNTDEIGPAGTYFVRYENDQVYIDWSFLAQDERRTFVISYQVDNAVLVHHDVAEFYYQFVGDKWDEGVGEVIVNLYLPQSAGEELRAWGHGPLWGEVTLVNDQHVQWTITSLPSKTFLEGRVTFPTEVVPNATNFTGKDALATILAEEEMNAERANRYRKAKSSDPYLAVILFAISIGVTITQWRKYGRELAPDFDGEYYRDLPNKYSPAELGVLWNTGAVQAQDLTATILDLARRGYLKIEEVVSESQGMLRKKERVDYQLTRLESIDQESTPLRLHEQSLLDFLFQDVAKQDKITSFDEIETYAKKKQSKFIKFWSDWQADVKNEAEQWDFFDQTISKYRNRLAGIGALVFFAAIPFLIYRLFLVALACFASGLVLLIAGIAMHRRSQSGTNDYARWRAFKRFLEDFSEIPRHQIPALVIWEHYLVYAVTLGVASEVIKQLELVYPGLEDGGYMFGYGWYYYSGMAHIHARQNSINRMTDSLQNSMKSSISTAQSSGSGSGGGFSGGGGGGFGGGGGGAR